MRRIEKNEKQERLVTQVPRPRPIALGLHRKSVLNRVHPQAVQPQATHPQQTYSQLARPHLRRCISLPISLPSLILLPGSPWPEASNNHQAEITLRTNALDSPDSPDSPDISCSPWSTDSPYSTASTSSLDSSGSPTPSDDKFLSTLSWIQSAIARLERLRSHLVTAEASAELTDAALAHPDNEHPDDAHPDDAHPNDAHPNDAHLNDAHLNKEKPPADASAVGVHLLLDSTRLLLAQQALRSLILENPHALPGTLPCAGLVPPSRFLNVFLGLAQAAHRDLFPRNIIGIGAGNGFIERCFASIGCQVRAYDRHPCHDYIRVQQAEFPKDIARCLPQDCSTSVLLAGYPEGYLGPVLAEFIRRGGQLLCTTVQSGLFTDSHEGYEDNPQVLRQAIRTLTEKKTGDCFEVELRSCSTGSAPFFIQFYNFPPAVRQLMHDTPELNDFCSNIDL